MSSPHAFSLFAKHFMRHDIMTALAGRSLQSISRVTTVFAKCSLQRHIGYRRIGISFAIRSAITVFAARSLQRQRIRYHLFRHAVFTFTAKQIICHDPLLCARCPKLQSISSAATVFSACSLQSKSSVTTVFAARSLQSM